MAEKSEKNRTERVESKVVIRDPLVEAIENFRRVTGVKVGDLVETIGERPLSMEDKLKLTALIDEMTETLSKRIENLINTASPKESGFPVPVGEEIHKKSA
jgi:hypothetical protein